jgi:Holliday junction resolvase RusA-like endonuclease
MADNRHLVTGKTSQIPGARGFKGFPSGPRLRDWTGETFTITLEIPDRSLHVNDHRGRSWLSSIIRGRTIAKHRARAAHAAGFVLFYAKAAPPMWERATVQARYYFKTRARRDKDGLVAILKSYLDGIADAGIIGNDHGFTAPTVEEDFDRERPRVEITITKIQ